MFGKKDEPKLPDKGAASVIMYDGTNQDLVHKHKIENFNLGSQLIVHEAQEAVFFRDGMALDLFGAGRHTLETQNLPFFNRAFKLPTNAETIFHAEVYFINKAVQMGIKWGTDTKVRFIEPDSGLPIEIGACGQFSLLVNDSRKLLIKLVGTADGMSYKTLSANSNEYGPAVSKFKAMVITKVKSNLARIIKSCNINILEIDEHLEDISGSLRQNINESLEEYGLTMPEFYVETVMTPDDDPNYRRLKQQHADMFLKIRQEEILKAEAEKARERMAVEAETEAQLKVISAQGEAQALRLRAAAEAEEMRMKGFTYREQTAREIGVEAAKNMGGSAGGSAVGDIAGLGIALGAMSGVVDMTKNVMNPMTEAASGAVNTAPSDAWVCSCGAENTTKFCGSCGKPKLQAQNADTWLCSCGTSNTMKFCGNCGKPKPAADNKWICPVCGTENTTKFCCDCGKARPEADEERKGE